MRCPNIFLTITLTTEVVIAIRHDLFFLHDQSAGGLEDGGGLAVTKRLKKGFNIRFDLRQFFAIDRSALRTEAEAVVPDLEEADAVALAGEGFVEDEDGGFHPVVGIETPGREGHHGDEMAARPVGVRCSAM